MSEIRHRFYEKTKKEKSKILALLILSAIGLILLSVLLSWLTGYWLIAGISIPVTLTILAPFIDVPQMVSSGKLIYLSPLFFAEPQKKNTITLHGGTIFDYLFVLDRNTNGQHRVKVILLCYIRGILKLIETTGEANKTDPVVRGTSMILTDSTARKFGFKPVTTDLIQTVIILFNYVNLTLANSFAKARFSFPKISRIKTYQAKLSDLEKRKKQLLYLEEQLSRAIATPTTSNAGDPA